jgi:ArsR family transcriptional regulator
MKPTEFFSALAHDTRLRCLVLLYRHDELSVCELTYALDVSQPHISHHLGHLRALGVVVDRREGLRVFYQINPFLPDWAMAALGETTSGILDNPPFAEDDKTLLSMPNRPEQAYRAWEDAAAHSVQSVMSASQDADVCGS